MKLCTDFTNSPPRPYKRVGYKSWYIRQTVGGKRVQRSLHTASKREAEVVAYRIWYAQQNSVVRGSILAAPEIPLSSAWESYSATERHRLLAPSSQSSRERRWNAFLAWAKTKCLNYMDSIDQSTATAYLASLESKGKTWNNARSDLAAVLPVFSETEQRSTTRGEAASDVVRPLDDDEIKKILDYLADPSCNMDYAAGWHAAVRIALGTGLRYKCVCLLRWDCIKDGVLSVLPEKTKRLNKYVLMTLPPRLMSMLNAMPRTSEFVLPDMAARHNDRNSGNPFQQMLRRLGIKSDSRGRAGFHSLRVVFSTRAGAVGIDTKLLGGILGHTTEAQTEHYNRASIHVDLKDVEW